MRMADCLNFAVKAPERLYRIGILTNHAEIAEAFDIYGCKDNRIEEFIPGRNYVAFIVKRKIKL
jgi:hypothetical protein